MLYTALYLLTFCCFQPSSSIYNQLNRSSNKSKIASPYFKGEEYGTLDHKALQKNEVSIISLLLLI